MTTRYLFALSLSFIVLRAAAQNDSPYAKFGYQGRVLRTPQERQQYMLIIPNNDTTATVRNIGLEPQKGKYYLFSKEGIIIASDTINGTNISRFLTTDPSAQKFPNDSPYGYCSNNPIIYVDPDGREKIIVIGGGDNTAKDRYKFVNSGVGQMLSYAKNNGGQEPITIVVTDKFLDAQSRQYLQTWANATSINYGVAINVVTVNSGDGITNYLNSKSTSSGNLSGARTSDQITSLSFFGHGYSYKDSSQGRVDSFEPGHGTLGEDQFLPNSPRPEHDKWAWGVQDVGLISPSAFAQNSSVNFYSCNAATPNADGVSLASVFSSRLGNKATVSGFFGRTSYEHIYQNINLMERLNMRLTGGLGPASALPNSGNKTPGTGNGTSEQFFFKSGKKQ